MPIMDYLEAVLKRADLDETVCGDTMRNVTTAIVGKNDPSSQPSDSLANLRLNLNATNGVYQINIFAGGMMGWQHSLTILVDNGSKALLQSFVGAYSLGEWMRGEKGASVQYNCQNLATAIKNRNENQLPALGGWLDDFFDLFQASDNENAVLDVIGQLFGTIGKSGPLLKYYISKGTLQLEWTHYSFPGRGAQLVLGGQGHGNFCPCIIL